MKLGLPVFSPDGRQTGTGRSSPRGLNAGPGTQEESVGMKRIRRGSAIFSLLLGIPGQARCVHAA
jgi:hypothetical protein